MWAELDGCPGRDQLFWMRFCNSDLLHILYVACKLFKLLGHGPVDSLG